MDERKKAAVQHFTIDGCVFLSLIPNTPINGFRFNLLWITCNSVASQNTWIREALADLHLQQYGLTSEDMRDHVMWGFTHTYLSRSVWIVSIRKCMAASSWHILSLMLRFTDQGAALFVDWRQPKLHCARRTIQQCLPSKLHSGRRMAWLCKQRRSPLRASASGPDGSPLLSALQPFFDKAESKRSISSYTGGGSQSQVLLPTGENNSRRLSLDSIVTVFNAVWSVLFKLFCELLYAETHGFGGTNCRGGANICLCSLCSVENTFVHCFYWLVCGDGKLQNSNCWFLNVLKLSHNWVFQKETLEGAIYTEMFLF